MKVAIFLVVLVAILGLLAALPAIEIDKDAVVSSSAWAWIIAACYLSRSIQFPQSALLFWLYGCSG